MTKGLDEMNASELGQLFPIIITEHNPQWKLLYASEKAAIEQAVGQKKIARISHIGSTAVPGLPAKPTIDILLEIKKDTIIEDLTADIKNIGYHYSKQPDKPAPHMMFMKGYTLKGFAGQAYHLHVRYPGDWDELNFRDYLIAHPDVAQEYARLKRSLQAKYTNDREAYTQGKTEYIKQVTIKARAEKNS